MINHRLSSLSLVVGLLLAACASPTISPPSTTVPPTATIAPTDTLVPPTATEAPTETPVPPTATPEPTATPDVLALDPIRIEFSSTDGTPLVGYYYPAAVENAPVVVLMHWVGGSNCDWLGVNLVQWLQNRNAPDGVAANPACQNAELFITSPLDLYPPQPAGTSYAVFAFDLRGHGESGGPAGQFQFSDGVKDSIAGMQTARTLEGVDGDRVATMGASIGADGAIDGCGEGCLGALSFSPGNYYDILYRTAVETLGVDQKPAWCIAATGDGEAFPTCESAEGEHYTKIIFEGERAHAMAMFDPDFKFASELRQSIFDYVTLVFNN